MKRVLFILVLSCVTTIIMAQTKKVAVWETQCNGEGISLLKSILVRGGLEEAVDNTPGYIKYDRAMIDAVRKEYKFQQSGAVKDSDIRRMGKMAGVQYVIVPEVSLEDNYFCIVVRIIDVESGESRTAKQLCNATAPEIDNACTVLAERLFGITVSDKSNTTRMVNDGIKATSNGLKYNFLEVNNNGQRVQVGDLLVGELLIRFEDDTLFSNVGTPDRIFQVAENSMFKGDIQEGLLMLHIGDKAVFNIPADSVSNLMQPGQMPPKYEQGKGQFFYYEIALMDIVTKDELAREQSNYVEEMNQRKENEPATLAQYIADNNITTNPTESGLYVIVKKKGDGPKVATGRKVSVNYTGRLLDGTLFDTSREADARKAGKYMQGRTYEPITYIVGEQSMIKGWEEGIMDQPEGSILQLIVPSALGYGSRGAGNGIPPYTPLVFDVEIISVQ